MGRIEVLYNGTWGTICGNNFDYNDGGVICRQLGYIGVNSQGIYFGKGTGPIWLSNMQCAGSEPSLTTCRKSSWGINNCTHDQDVSLSCATGM